MFNQEKSLWSSSTVFIIAMIGAVLSLTSLTQFSYIMYGNGGGAFLIPYIIAMVLIGIPLLVLEFGVGLKFRSSLSKVFYNIKMEYEYLGWFIIFIMFLLLSICICVMGWDLIYIILSLFKGWGANPNIFFNESLLHSSTSPYALTYIMVPIGIAVMAIWGAIYFISKSGINLIGKINMVLVPLMIILLVIIFIFVFTLSGSKIAMSLIISPDWSCLLNYQVWLTAFTQVISALLLGQAVSVSYSSYLNDNGENKLHIVDSAWIIALVSFIFQIIFTLIVFGLLGAMVNVNPLINTEFANGISLVFIVIPNAFNTMGIWGNIIGFAFFVMLFIAGLTTAIAIIEPFISSLVEKFSFSRSRSLRYLCLIGIFTSFVFTTGFGQYLISVVSQFLMEFAILLAILLEVVIIGWVYGADRLMNTLNRGTFVKVDTFWIIFIKFVTPIILIILLIFGLYDLILTGNKTTLFIDSVVAVIFVIAPLVLTLNLIDNDRFDLDLNLDLHVPGSSKPKAEFTDDGTFVNPYKGSKDKKNGKNVLRNVDLSSSTFDSPTESTLDDFKESEDDPRGKSVFGKINMFNKAKEVQDSDSNNNILEDSDENDLGSSDVESTFNSEDYLNEVFDDKEESKSRFSLFKNSITKSNILGNTNDNELEELIGVNSIDLDSKNDYLGNPNDLDNSVDEKNSKSNSSKSRFKNAVNFDFGFENDGSNRISNKNSKSSNDIIEESIDISKLQSNYKENEEFDDLDINESKDNSKSSKSSKSKDDKSEEVVYQDFTDDFFDDDVFGDEGYESLLDDYDAKSSNDSNNNLKFKSDIELDSKFNENKEYVTKAKSKPKARINRVKGKPKTITISADKFDEDQVYDFEDKGADSVFNLDE